MESDFENPEPKSGETRAKFVKRCRPIVHREHPSWKMSRVIAACHSIWERKHKDEMEMNGFEIFHDRAQLIDVPTETIVENEEFTNTPGTKKLVAIYGDRFMNGGFVPMAVLQKCYKQWDGSLHDINHMGTSTGFFLAQSDITYFIGYHSNVKLNKPNKSVSMELHIHNRTKFAEAWEAYVELCDMAGKIPNVSTTYYGKREFLPTNKLPKECNWKKEGYGKDDLVPVLTEMQPVCVSTVLRGRCDDKGGCGIRNTDSETCDSNSETENNEKINLIVTVESNEEFEKKRQDLINKIKNLKKEINSEDK